jgi:hypothetical protein
VGRDSAVGIATRYGLDSTGIFDHFCDLSCRFHHYRRSHPPVRTGIWRPTKPAKIEGPSGRKLVHTRDHIWDRLPSLCDHLSRHILGHYRANDERHLGASNREGERAGTGSLRSGLLPGKPEAICQHLSLVKNLVSRANPAGPRHTPNN